LATKNYDKDIFLKRNTWSSSATIENVSEKYAFRERIIKKNLPRINFDGKYDGSDKSYLVIDDPLSSYDIPNQYRIIYEIASAKKDNKHILIFTHNIDTINIANSQYSSAFEYEIMEKRKNTLYLNSVGYTASANVLSLTELLNHIEITYPHLNYLKLLLAKDEWEDTSDNHLIFHYDCPFNIDIDGINYSNDYLVNLIENFDDKTFQNSSYLNNTADKIIYCAAIRAWIEKQFYVNLSGDTGLQRKQFGDKIRYVFGGNRWNGSSRVTKEYLMSKKVMLNQHVHTESQKMPFYYSLNLTFDDITKEILDIKNKTVIVKGSYDYINKVNKCLNDKVNKVINCFELNIFEENSREILKCHDYILNTSGIKKISDMFHMNWSKNSILT